MSETEIVLSPPFDNYFLVDLLPTATPQDLPLKIAFQQAQVSFVQIDGIEVKFENKWIVYVYGKSSAGVLASLVRFKTIKSYEKLPGVEKIILKLPVKEVENGPMA